MRIIISSTRYILSAFINQDSISALMAQSGDKPVPRIVIHRSDYKALEENLRQVLDDAINEGTITPEMNESLARLLAELRVRQQSVPK